MVTLMKTKKELFRMFTTRIQRRPEVMTKAYTVEVDDFAFFMGKEVERQVVSKLSDKIVEAFMINYGETFMGNINLEKLTEVVNEQLIVKVKGCLK